MALLLSAGLVHAQTSAPIDQGNQEFLRQQERERQLRQQQEPAPDVRLQAPSAAAPLGRVPASETPCFTIERIVLIGKMTQKFQWSIGAADVADDGTLDRVTQRCIGVRGIDLAMSRIQNAIVARGYVTTRVLAEPQDLKSGTLSLTLIPGKIHSIRFAAGTDARATQFNAVPAAPGDLLNLRDIEQALENFKRVPSVDADIQITPAEGVDAQPGESDLVIQWKQSFPIRVNLSTDDSGTKATGRYQGNVSVSYDHWWTVNDLFYISFNHDLADGNGEQRGTRAYTVHYSLPFGYWLLGLTTSNNEYHQAIAGASQTYIYSGESQNTDVRLSRVVYRDAQRKTTLALRGWARDSHNFIDDTEVDVQRRRMAGWDFGVSHREFIRAATLDANLNYRQGTGALNALPAPEENFGEGTSRPRIILADALLNLPVALSEQHLRYSLAWRAQWNRTPLVPQDRFAIGGRYTVRGFDGETLLSADRGWLLRNDLGFALGTSGQELYIGADYGEVGGQSSVNLIGTRLAGAVLGLRGGYRQVAYEVFVGQPLHKPAGFDTAAVTAGFNLNYAF